MNLNIVIHNLILNSHYEITFYVENIIATD